MPEAPDYRPEPRTSSMPTRIAGIYTVAGLLWIFVSDRLTIATAGSSTGLMEAISMVKGALYVLLTGALLYRLLGRWAQRQTKTHAAALSLQDELRRLFDDAPIAAWVVTADGRRVLDVNRVALAQRGWSRAEFLELEPGSLMPPTEGSEAERTQPTRDGGTLVVRLTSHHLVYQHVPALLVYANDLTAQRAAEESLKQTEQSFGEMLGALAEAIWISDPAFTRFYFVSAAAEAICGIPAQADAPGRWLTLVHPDDRATLQTTLSNAAAGRESSASGLRLRRADGADRFVEVSVAPVTNAAGEVVRLIGSLSDVTERREVEAEYRLVAQMFTDTRDAILIVDENRSIIRANRAFDGMTGYRQAELVGQTPRMLQSGMHDPAYYASMNAALAQEGHWEGQIWDRRKNGEVFPARLSITRVGGGDQPVHYIAVSADLTEARRAEARIHSLVNFDPVTGLANRTLFQARLGEALASRPVNGVTLLLLGVDRFTAINQVQGHAAGDRVLAALADRLVDALPAGTNVARFSGDRFAVMLDGDLDEAAVQETARALTAAVAASASASEAPFPLTAGVGVARSPGNGTTVPELLRSAETALNHAKALGHGRMASLSATLDAEASARLRIEARLRRAVAEGSLRLHYQPQITLAVARCESVEALLRWTDPVLGEVPPGKFIPIAESSTLILQLGDWVLREACRQAHAWHREGHPLRVAVNISAVQFRQPEFVESVRGALQASGLQPQLLELEVTESVVMEGANHVTATLQALRGLGLHLSIDDFGTGYSSLAYLRRFPIDKLKIDQSFIRDMLHDADAAAVTQAIVDLAKSLRLRVIAEGVETEDQARFLTTIGCDEAQGWLYAKAMPEAMLAEWLLQHPGRAHPQVRPPE